MQGDGSRLWLRRREPLWLFPCLSLYAFTLPLGAGEALSPGSVKHYTKLRSLDGRSEEPVVSNVTELRLANTLNGDTGWYMQTELAFTRDPPLYWERDESIDLSCVLMLYRAKGEKGKSPFRVGHVVTGQVLVQGSPASELNYIPVVPVVKFRSRRARF